MSDRGMYLRDCQSYGCDKALDDGIKAFLVITFDTEEPVLNPPKMMGEPSERLPLLANSELIARTAGDCSTKVDSILIILDTSASSDETNSPILCPDVLVTYGANCPGNLRKLVAYC